MFVFFSTDLVPEVPGLLTTLVLAILELPHFIVFTAIRGVHIVGYSLPGSGNSPL